jgi:hypothetical protein
MRVRRDYRSVMAFGLVGLIIGALHITTERPVTPTTRGVNEYVPF